MQYHRTPEL